MFLNYEGFICEKRKVCPSNLSKKGAHKKIHGRLVMVNIGRDLMEEVTYSTCGVNHGSDITRSKAEKIPKFTKDITVGA